MDHNVESFKVFGVDAALIRMPSDFRCAKRVFAAHEPHDFVTIIRQRPHQRLADKPVRTTHEDFHVHRLHRLHRDFCAICGFLLSFISEV